MSKIVVPEADWLNIDKKKIAAVDGSHEFSRCLTIPIRKKAWYRAHNAKKLWAYVPYALHKAILESGKYARVFPGMYIPNDRYYTVWPHE